MRLVRELRWSAWTRWAAVLAVVTGAASAQALVVQVGSRAGLGPVVAEADWGPLGGDGTPVAAPAVSTPVTVSGAAAYTVFEQGNSWSGNFAPGTHVLAMFDMSTFELLDGDIHIVLDAPVSAVGTQIQAAAFGAFSVDVLLYNAANVLIGNFIGIAGDSTAAGDDSALFIGFVSSAADIARLQIVGAGPAAINSVTIGGVQIDAPAPLWLMLAAMAAFVGVRRRRA